MFGEERADREQTASAGWPRSFLTERRPPIDSYAAHEPLRYNMSATSTLARSVRAMASQFFSHRSSVSTSRGASVYLSLYAQTIAVIVSATRVSNTPTTTYRGGVTTPYRSGHILVTRARP